MKKILSILLVLLTIAGCSTDFDLTADYKEVMVVYGLLNQTEQSHYLRIHKGYLDEDESALKFSGNPDSIYYGDYLDVVIAEKNNGQTTQQWKLQRIDGDTLNPPISKDSGTFAASPNILYHFSAKLNPDLQYELRIENSQTGKVVTSTTGLVRDFDVVYPISGFKIPWTSANQLNLRWALARNSEIYDLKVKMHYSIANASDPLNKVSRDSVQWYIFKNRVYDETNPTYTYPIDQFLQAVSVNFDPDPSIVRYFDSLDFNYTVGTPVFSDYISFSIAQSGITQDQAGQRYTNLDGAYGLFSGRYDKTVEGVKISNQTLDSLACGSQTGDLGFAPTNDPETYPDYPFCN